MGWAKRHSSLVALLCSFTSACSFLFEPTELDAGPPPPCLGAQRTFERGEPLVPGRFPRIDYRQGTLTFWVRPLQEFDAQTSLVDLQGIRISALPGTGLRVDMDGLGTFDVPDPAWVVGEDHFVSLRWDGSHSLSGSATLQAQVEIRVDQQEAFFAMQTPFDLEPTASADLVVGSADHRFHVDQFVLYDRPLFVDNDTDVPSGLYDMAESKGLRAVVEDAGFDVVLATAAPRLGSCDSYEALAWAPATPLHAADFRLGNSVGWTGATMPLSVEDVIYPDGGFAISEPVSLTLQVAPGGSYVVEVLTHGGNGDGKRGNVQLFFGTKALPFTFAQAQDGTREAPARLLVSFTNNSEDREIRIELSPLNEGSATSIHSVRVYPNLLDDGGFESDEPVSDELWERQQPREELGVSTSLDYLGILLSYEGRKSACLDGDGSPHVLQQEASPVADDEFFLFGGAFLWRSGLAPAAAVGNGTFFGVNLPYDRQVKALVETADQPDVWQVVGSAARRLSSPELNSHNDLLRYGANSYAPETGASHCIDSAFAIELERIHGEASLPTE